MKSDIRWVGFDMDECIGSVMPLYDFIHKLRGQEDFLQMCDSLYESEITGRTWLFRPAIFKALRLLWAAYDRGAIQGAFILSNNSSDALVQTVGIMLNVFIQRLVNKEHATLVFQLAISMGSPCRAAFGDVKSYEVVQHSLSAHNLQPCTSPEHLLFFDDMSHVLQSQIPHYVRVPPYFNHIDVMIIADVLDPLGEARDDWQSAVDGAKARQTRDVVAARLEDIAYILTPQETEQTEEDETMFRKAFQDFLGTGRPSRVNKKTLRGTKTRKSRRRASFRPAEVL